MHERLLRAELLAIGQRVRAFEEIVRTARAMAKIRAEVQAECDHVAAIRRQIEEDKLWQQ